MPINKSIFLSFPIIFFLFSCEAAQITHDNLPTDLVMVPGDVHSGNSGYFVNIVNSKNVFSRISFTLRGQNVSIQRGAIESILCDNTGAIDIFIVELNNRRSRAQIRLDFTYPILESGAVEKKQNAIIIKLFQLMHQVKTVDMVDLISKPVDSINSLL